MTDPLIPTPLLLIKLDSIIVHFEEYNSENGNPVDLAAAKALLLNDDVLEWMSSMRKMSFLPVKR